MSPKADMDSVWLGVEATIPGGVGLTAQSYAQVIMGRYNNPIGTSIPATILPNDPLIIAGNGVSGTPSNAWEISNEGYSTAFRHAPVGESIAVGGTYQNNTIESWGHVPKGPLVGFPVPVVGFTGIGISGIMKIGNGTYTITLNTHGPDGSSYTLSDGSVTVTVEDAGTDTPFCGYATTTAITAGVFTVHIHDASSTTCQLIDEGFFFKVCGQ